MQSLLPPNILCQNHFLVKLSNNPHFQFEQLYVMDKLGLNKKKILLGELVLSGNTLKYSKTIWRNKKIIKCYLNENYFFLNLKFNIKFIKFRIFNNTLSAFGKDCGKHFSIPIYYPNKYNLFLIFVYQYLEITLPST